MIESVTITVTSSGDMKDFWLIIWRIYNILKTSGMPDLGKEE